MSSFKRTGKIVSGTTSTVNEVKTESLVGTKAWINHVRLVSTGLAQLDHFIGGGWPVGSLILMEEDQNATHSNTLSQYFMAQGLACKHKVHAVGADALVPFSRTYQRLPVNVSHSSHRSITISKTSQTSNHSQSVNNNPADELKIAWQYKKYLPSQSNVSNTDQSDQDEIYSPHTHELQAMPQTADEKTDTSSHTKELQAMPQTADEKTDTSSHTKEIDQTKSNRQKPLNNRIKYCNAFDLHRSMPQDELKQTDFSALNVSRIHNQGFEPFTSSNVDNTRSTNNDMETGGILQDKATTYTRAYASIQNVLNASENQTRITRVCVLGAGGAGWGSLSQSSSQTDQFLSFLYQLKSAIEKATTAGGQPRAVAVVTVPVHLFSASVLNATRRIADAVISLTAFAESDSNSLFSAVASSASESATLLSGQTQKTSREFQDYTGLIRFVRLPRINSMTQHRPDTMIYLFKRDRRKMTIEKLHLPPEDSRSSGLVSANPQDARPDLALNQTSSSSTLAQNTDASGPSKTSKSNQNIGYEELGTDQLNATSTNASVSTNSQSIQQEDKLSSRQMILDRTADMMRSSLPISMGSTGKQQLGGGGSFTNSGLMGLEGFPSFPTRTTGQTQTASRFSRSNISQQRPPSSPPLQPGMACRTGIQQQKNPFDF